jgi:hypothetical protein
MYIVVGSRPFEKSTSSGVSRRIHCWERLAEAALTFGQPHSSMVPVLTPAHTIN